MPVREATASDVEEITAMVLEHAAHEGSPEACHFDPRSGGDALFGESAVLRALIAFVQTDPRTHAGCLLWYPTFSSWAAVGGAWVEDLFVRPRFRRNGLGREMLFALRAMVEGRIEWDVHVANEAARQFYERLGARPVTEWTKYRWHS